MLCRAGRKFHHATLSQAPAHAQQGSDDPPHKGESKRHLHLVAQIIF